MLKDCIEWKSIRASVNCQSSLGSIILINLLDPIQITNRSFTWIFLKPCKPKILLIPCYVKRYISIRDTAAVFIRRNSELVGEDLVLMIQCHKSITRTRSTGAQFSWETLTKSRKWFLIHPQTGWLSKAAPASLVKVTTTTTTPPTRTVQSQSLLWIGTMDTHTFVGLRPKIRCV